MKKAKISIDLTKPFRVLESKKNFQSGSPPSDKEISELEKKLNVKFPKSYICFLKNYGYISFFGGAIYGPSKNEYFDLITRNKELREEVFPKEYNSFPKDAFAIEEYAGGGYFMLFSEDSPRAGEVGLFLDETLNNEDQTWPSFEAFLEDYYCSED